MAITGKCHCGNVEFTIPSIPETATSCDCSTCNRLGALWGYFEPGEVEIHCSLQDTAVYCWGDQFIDFHHCPICGCTTHYISTQKAKDEISFVKTAVNCRMLSLEVLNEIPIRKVSNV